MLTTTLFSKGLTNPLNNLKTIKDANIDLLNELKYLSSEVMYHGKCDFCGIGIKDRASLRRHYKSKHADKIVECDKCDEKFPCNSFLYHHIIDNHILYTKNSSDKLSCFICGDESTFGSRNALTKHYKSHHYKITKYPCKVCGFEASTSSNLKAHMNTHSETSEKTTGEKLYHCQFENDPENPCTSMAPTKYKSGYARHMLRSHGIEIEGYTALKCKYCDFVEYDKVKYENHVECHIKGKIYPCLCQITPDKCGIIKTSKEMQKHKVKVHGIIVLKKKGGTKEKKFICDISEGKCATEPYKCTSNADLKRHKKFKHNIGVTWFICDQCPKDSAYKGKTKRNLEVHIAGVHGTEKKYTCDLCPKDEAVSSFYESSINKHKREVHGIGLEMFHCEHCETETQFKRKSHLEKHIKEVHGIGEIKMYTCKHCKDEIQFKRKSHLQQHIIQVHNIGGENLVCDICNKYTCKTKYHLTRHKAFEHNINAKKFVCDICNQFIAKEKYNLKSHKEFIHDIGEFKCDFCIGNRNSHIPYKDSAGNHHICKKCYKKATGKESRIELIASDYLDEHFGTEFLLGSDKSLKSMGGSLRYRPDKLYASDDFVLIIEIDENQHKYANGTYDCEEKRISDIYDEFAGKTLACIRWNPHTYKPPDGEKKALRAERLKMLLKLAQTLKKNPPRDKMSNFYMYYDADSPRLSRKIPKTLVYKEDQIDKLNIN